MQRDLAVVRPAELGEAATVRLARVVVDDLIMLLDPQLLDFANYLAHLLHVLLERVVLVVDDQPHAHVRHRQEQPCEHAEQQAKTLQELRMLWLDHCGRRRRQLDVCAIYRRQLLLHVRRHHLG